MFFELRIRFVKVWRSPTTILCLNEVTRVFLAHVMHMQGQGYVRMVNTHIHKPVYAYIGKKVEMDPFLVLSMTLFPRLSLVIPTT